MYIVFEQANIGYDEKIILKQVDFTLDAHQFVFLTGKIGSGKSTFLKSIYAEAKIFSARTAQVLDFNLLKLKKRKIPRLRRQIGFIFQDFKFLPDKNVYENLRFVLRATGWNNEMKIRRRIHEVLKAVDMLDFQNAMTFELSGGQQQKIAIARALLNNPKIILADEPTGNLDPQASLQITSLLFELSKKFETSVLMATHDLNAINSLPNQPTYLVENSQITKIK